MVSGMEMKDLLLVIYFWNIFFFFWLWTGVDWIFFFGII